MWTQNSEEAINNMTDNPLALEDWFNINVSQIEVLTDLVRGELSDLKRRVIVALITVDVHARDIVEELKADQVSSINEFKWMKQLKYYWDEDADDIRIK
jgi:dynein heavy chain